MRRVRRPLLALIVLVVALAVGYAVKALRADPQQPNPVPSVVRTLPDTLQQLPWRISGSSDPCQSVRCVR